MLRRTAALLLAMLGSCELAGQPRPASTAPLQLRERVAAFAQPTQEGRLAALTAQLEAAGLAHTIEAFAGDRPPPARGYNVLVRTGPASGKEILLVAHYDAVVLDNGKLVDGLVDNAASVVAMIETTRRIAGKTRHPVRLLLTDQEELGLLGARAFLAAHGTGNLAAVINADVNGYGDTLMYGLNNGPQSAFLNQAVGELCAARQTSCLGFPNYPPSDEVAFFKAGAAAISIGYQPRSEAEKLRAFMLEPAKAPSVPEVLSVIHTAGDTIALIDPATLEEAADFLSALVLKLDASLP